MRTKNGMEYWVVNSWEPLTATPVIGWRSVWAETQGENWYRLAYPVDCIGVARRTTTHYSRPVGQPEQPGTIEQRESYNEVVAYEYIGSEGWQVIDDANNYCGLIRGGEDLTMANSHRDCSKFPDDKEVAPPST